MGGLGVLLPPLLTIVILLWVWNTVKYYVLEPVTGGARNVLTWSLAEVRTELPGARPAPKDPTVFVTPDGRRFKRLERGEFVPMHVYQAVLRSDGADAIPGRGLSLYRRYVDITYLRPRVVVPVFLSLFVLLMYLLGTMFAAGVGQAFWSFLDQGFGRLPLVRGVYGSVKQVTDFMLTQSELDFTRVVAVEYPAKGLWAIAFVTGEAFSEVTQSAGKAMLSVMVPTSPMPMTGFTMMVLKSEVVDLDLTVDEACQFIISCGVVVPREQLGTLARAN